MAAWPTSSARPPLISTHLGFPALWWCGHLSIGCDGSQATRGAYIVEPGQRCCGVDEALQPHRRALVYIGFPDTPTGFDELLLAELDRVGAITAYRKEAELSRAAVVEVGAPGPNAPNFKVHHPSSRGCVVIKSAARN